MIKTLEITVGKWKKKQEHLFEKYFMFFYVTHPDSVSHFIVIPIFLFFITGQLRNFLWNDIAYGLAYYILNSILSHTVML